jgi:hypothetical protein
VSWWAAPLYVPYRNLRALSPDHLTIASVADIRFEDKFAGAKNDVCRQNQRASVGHIQDLTPHAAIPSIEHNPRSLEHPSPGRATLFVGLIVVAVH